MMSAKQGNYWYHFCLWYGAVLVGRLNPGLLALEASTLPLGYRGGGVYIEVTYKWMVIKTKYMRDKKSSKILLITGFS